MSRFLLVPENFDLDEVKEICIPKNLYPDAKEETPKEIKKQTEKVEKLENENNSAEKVKGKYLSPAVINFAFDPAKARQLLKFLKEKEIKQDKKGRLIFKNKLYPILLEPSFLDLINDNRKTKQCNDFYQLLRKNGVDSSILPKNKQKYFKM